MIKNKVNPKLQVGLIIYLAFLSVFLCVWMPVGSLSEVRIPQQKGPLAKSIKIATPTVTSMSPRSVSPKLSEDYYIGGMICDYLAKRTWGVFWKQLDPVKALYEHGFERVRVQVTTVSSSDLRNTHPSQWHILPWKNEYWSCQEYAEQILKEASDAGMKLSLVLLLSNEAAYAWRQNAPPEWQNLDVENLSIALEQYCFKVAKYFKDRGLDIDIYEIGNEIEWGILNFLPGQKIILPPGVDVTRDIEYMRNKVWNIEAVLLKAAIKGVKIADPEAKIVLHINTLGYNRENYITKGFFEAMVNNGVDFDYAGLSYPYIFYYEVPQPYFKSSELQDVINTISSLGKKIIFCEFSYPNSSFGIEKAIPVPGYPFTPEGQSLWLKDFLFYCQNNPNIIGFYYFYPEYFQGMANGKAPELESSGLFKSDTQIQPAMEEFLLIQPVLPPTNVKITRLTNDFIFFREYINRISWQRDPREKSKIIKYRIHYKVKGSNNKYILLTEVNGTDFVYHHRGLKSDQFFSYRITAVDDLNNESLAVTVSN